MRRVRAVSKLLNRPGHHSTAAIACRVEIHNWNGGLDAEIQISDCDRRISLDLEDHTPAAYSNSLYKIDTLINTLTKFKGQFMDAHDDALAERAKTAKNRKKR